MTAMTAMLVRSGRRFLPATWMVLLSATDLISSSGCGGREASAPGTNVRVGSETDLADAASPSNADAAPAVETSPGVIVGPSQPAVDASCVRSVWGPTDVGFTYTDLGEAAQLNRGCGPFRFEYDFALAGGEGTLTEHACGYNGPVNETVSLAAEQVALITTTLSNLHTVCSPGCSVDGPTITLAIGPTTYDNDLVVGCLEPTTLLFISTNALVLLEQQLNSIVNAACAADAGTDAGACMQAPPGGG
jgi:hypothetical protein